MTCYALGLIFLIVLYPHQHFNVGVRVEGEVQIYRCSRCGLERTMFEIADELQALEAVMERLHEGEG